MAFFMGICTPELVGKDKACFDYFLNYLEERNIHYTKISRLL